MFLVIAGLSLAGSLMILATLGIVFGIVYIAYPHTWLALVVLLRTDGVQYVPASFCTVNFWGRMPASCQCRLFAFCVLR